MSEEMTCRELAEFLPQYLSGELVTEQRKLFEDHLDECQDCGAYMKGYEEAVKLGKAAFAHLDEPIPAEVPEELVQAVLAARIKRMQ